MRINRNTGDIQARHIEVNVSEELLTATKSMMRPNLLSLPEETERVLERVLGLSVEGVEWTRTEVDPSTGDVKITAGSKNE